MKNMIKPALVLLIISFIVAFGIAAVNYLTKDIIAERLMQEALAQRKEVLEDATEFKDVSENINNLNQSQKNIIDEIYAGYNNDQFVGYAFKNTVKGYGGDMNVTVGVLSNGLVSKIIIGQNNETPGLGTRVAEKPFIEQYAGKKVMQYLKIVKNTPANEDEIQAISGATISSKAVNFAVSVDMSSAAELLENGGY